jgi:hypothetical protein
MTELLTDKVNGFFYDYPEYPYLAERIVQLFEDADLAERFSKSVRREAAMRHDRDRNPEEMIGVYKKIMNAVADGGDRSADPHVYHESPRDSCPGSRLRSGSDLCGSRGRGEA